MEISAEQWASLQTLRLGFLREKPLPHDYWNRETLSLYHQTFAQRIGWKWDAVLEEAASLDWKGGPAILDWGCGTGIAGEKYLERFPASGHYLWDRSPAAMEFVHSRFPKSVVEAAPPKPFVLLVSHTLTELTATALEELLTLAAKAEAVFWVEPGTSAASRKLIAARETLRQFLTTIAPCPHNGPCGLLTPDNAKQWCHHFAPPDAEAFQSRAWAEFGKRMKIDLRSLPVSYLIMTHGTSPGGTRILGRPRAYTGFARYLGCSEHGVKEERLLKREGKQMYKRLKKGGFSLKL